MAQPVPVRSPAVTIHGLEDAVAALRASGGAPITLLSAPGAALFAGCMWWREVVRLAHEVVPHAEATDILDCADAAGAALAALRTGQKAIVLHATAPGREAVLAIAQGCGAIVLAEAPLTLDLATSGARRRLDRWVRAGFPDRDDTGRGVG